MPLPIDGSMIALPQIIVGDGGLNIEQQKAQMGIWSIFAAVSAIVECVIVSTIHAHSHC